MNGCVILSIIVPVYNAEAFLYKCIESIRSQSFSDWELILIDDGSTDNSGEICESYVKQDARIQVIHKSNGGASSARNYGLDIARGKYITFVDSDDTVSRDTYQFNIDILEKDNNIELLQYPIQWRCGTSNPKIAIEKEQLLVGKNEIIKAWYNAFPINNSPCTKIYKKELFDNLRFLEGYCHEDNILFSQLLPRLNYVYISEYGRYDYYSINENSTLHTYDLKKAMNWVYAETLTLECMYMCQDIKNAYIPRFIRTIQYLLNLKEKYPQADISDGIRQIKQVVPPFRSLLYGTENFKNAVWFIFIHIFGLELFSRLYDLKLRHA